MIENYISFNIEKFVADCYEKKKMLPSLYETLRDIDGQKGIDPTKDKVQTSPTNDAVHNAAMLRIKIERKIADYEQDIKILQKAKNTLTDAEKQAIDICFGGGNIARQCADLCLEERTIFNRRKKALVKMTRAIIG